MVNAIEQLLQIDWKAFFIALAIVITAFIAIKKGLEELGKHINFEMPWLKNDRVHRELSEAVVAIKDELVALRNDVSHVKDEVTESKENRCHDRDDSRNIRATMYNDLNNTAATLRQELIDSVRSIEGKIDVLQKKIDDNELHKKIESLRTEIISFATNLGNPQFKPSIDHYNNIFKKMEDYEKILEDNGLENGQCSISIRCIEHKYGEAMERGDFLKVEGQ